MDGTRKDVVKMQLYYHNSRNDFKNSYYPQSVEINSVEKFKSVVTFDHVSAKYINNYRKKDNFISSDCFMFDVDNSESDNPANWFDAQYVHNLFSDVPMYICYSRNHMKIKDGKSARPKFHVYFPDVPFNDATAYQNIKDKVCDYFSGFDKNAKDIARFFIGVETPNVEYYQGNTFISEFINSKAETKDNVQERISSAKSSATNNIIPAGERNTTLHRYALKVLTKFGSQDNTAYNNFFEESKKCNPPLDNKELSDIWNSATKYYTNVVSKSPFYSAKYIPKVYTDVGEADIFSNLYIDCVRYSYSTQFLYYNGKKWEENDLKVRGLVHSLTELQLKEAHCLLDNAKKSDDSFDEKCGSVVSANSKYAEKYLKHALTYQNTCRIDATMKECAPKLSISISELDIDPYKLNTPMGTIDLKTSELLSHNSKDFCTKITATSPGLKGKELFDNFLDTICCSNVELIDYLQMIAGMIAIGKVFSENLIIAYGCGKNGKSTFFNLIAKVLGDYTGYLSADIFTSDCRKNKSAEYAELRGKRFVLTTELAEGKKLDTSVLKKLCSTDPILAEKKYKAPFSFIPSHSIVLYTNHLPTVTEGDNGTWRRLIVVPFNATISSENDIKNYSDYLFDNSAEYVLKWIVDGAKKYIENEHKIQQPFVVSQAIHSYKETNDWMSNFISDYCCVDKSYVQPSGELYKAYREFCKSEGESAVQKCVFNNALREKGFQFHKNSRGTFIYGVKLRKTELPLYSDIQNREMVVYGGQNNTFDEINVEF